MFKEYLANHRNTLEERLSVAKNLALELAQLDDFDKMSEHIMGTGSAQMLGDGVYGRVYAGTERGGGYVVKIANGDEGFQWYMDFALGSDNPIFPKLAARTKTLSKGGRQIDIYVLERLYVDDEYAETVFKELYAIEEDIDMVLLTNPKHSNHSFAFENLANFVRTGDYSEESLVKIKKFLQKYGRTFEQFEEFVSVMNKIVGETGELDVHEGNVGFDNSGGLVIFDPLSI